MKIKIILIVAILSLCFIFLTHSESDKRVSDKSAIVIKGNKTIRMNDLLARLAEGGITILFECDEDPFDKEVILEEREYTVTEIINKICNTKSGISYSQSDQIINIKDESLCGSVSYSLERPFSPPADIDKTLTSLGKDSGIIFVDPNEATKGLPDEIRKTIIEDMKKERQRTLEERASVENMQKRRKELERSQGQLDDFFKFRIALEKQRFCFIGMPEEWMLGIEKYNGKTIREVIVDIISRHKLCCWIHEIKGEEKDRLLKGNEQAVKDLKDANKEKYIDEGMLELLKPGPIYGIEIYKADYAPEEFDEGAEEASVNPDQEKTSIPEVPSVLDGMPLLKMSSVFNPKKNSLSVNIKNTSGKQIEFKGLKKNFLVLELYKDRKKETGLTMTRAIYCGEKTELPDAFSLAPGKTLDFDFMFDDARFKENYGFPLLWRVGIEDKVYLEKVPFQDLKDLGEVITFYPIIYFDLDGKRYKSSGEEALMVQE